MLIRVTAGLALCGLVSLPAAAQGPQSPRSYAVGYGGVANTEVTAPTFGGTFGFSLTPTVQVFGELSRSQDEKAQFTAEDLRLLDTGMTAAGIPFQSSVTMAVNYFSGGVKYVVPGRSVRPYLSVHGGLAHMSPNVNFSMFGIDVTSAAMSSGGMNTYFREETRPMAGFGAGVLFTSGHLLFDAGYKYSGIFIPSDYLQDPASPHSHTLINTHHFVAGAGVRF